MKNELFIPLSAALRADLNRLLDAVEKAFPLPAKYRASLPRDVAALSRSLTSARPDREGGYLGKPAELSAYLRYFLPWNVFRLSRLLPALDLDLRDGDAVTDLGSGPLTVPIALFLSRPDLRDKRLEFRCLDRTGKVLEAGASVFEALRASAPCGWKIRTIRGSLGTRIEGPKAALVTAANVFNELFWDERHPAAMEGIRKAPLLSALARDDGTILVVEPGIPRSGEFLSSLRGACMDLGRLPLAPCPHGEACPLPGGRRGAKWCHFAFETDEAPERLHRLSAAAGIPKERATLSFLHVGKAAGTERDAGTARPDSRDQGVRGGLAIRILSDAFRLPGNRSGRYGCCAEGLALVAGDERRITALASGSLISLPRSAGRPIRDEKSGAAVFPLDAASPIGG